MAVGAAERWLAVDFGNFWGFSGLHSWIRPTSNAAPARTGPWRCRIGIFESFVESTAMDRYRPKVCSISTRSRHVADIDIG